MGIGRRIKEARESNGFTQSELAELLGVTGSAITNYEKETSHPKEPIMYKLIDVLHVDANYLFQDVVKTQNSQNDISISELNIIKKYRALDTYGQETVNYILDRETVRTSQIKETPAYCVKEKPPTHIMQYHPRLASAGSGEYLFDSIPTDTIEVLTTKLSEQADFVIGVNGDSMAPTYDNSDKVLVCITDNILTGDIGIFTRGNECFVKELGVDGLKSHNKEYADIPASEEIRLVGKVLGKVDEL